MVVMVSLHSHIFIGPTVIHYVLLLPALFSTMAAWRYRGGVFEANASARSPSKLATEKMPGVYDMGSATVLHLLALASAWLHGTTIP